MARRLAFAVLLAALAPAAAAQPTAADAALVDSALVALRVPAAAELTRTTFREAFAAMTGPAPPFAGAMGRLLERFGTGVADSVRAAFLADLRPALLRQAIAQRSAAYGRMLDSTLAANREPGAVRRMMEDFRALDADPEAYPLADSALTARYLRANGTIGGPMEAMMGRFMRRMFERLPNVQAALDREGLTLDALTQQLMAMMREEMARSQILYTRYSLRNTPRSQLEAIVAYEESDAGRYVAERMWTGTERAAEPFLTGMIDLLVKHLPAPEDRG